MTTIDKLKKLEHNNESKLCIGLDTSFDKLPDFLQNDLSNILTFNKRIIDNTYDLVSSYKINFAFYEQYGATGYDYLEQTIAYIPEDIPIIADAKRGDIGNTSKAYAFSIFESLNCDAITVNPYMGYDSISPFLEYDDKLTFLLCLTSNKGSEDFEKLILSNGNSLFQEVIQKGQSWNINNNLAYVVGATHHRDLEILREIDKHSYFLIPGIGAQGGDLELVVKANNGSPFIINASRSIIYAGGNEKKYYENARKEAILLKNKINSF